MDEATPAEYDTSWKFQPTYIGHLSEVISEIIAKNIDHKILPVVVDDLKSRFDTANDILSPFGVKVVPVNNHDTAHFSEKKDISKLKELNLPTYTYQEMINRIIEEIKNRNFYQLK